MIVMNAPALVAAALIGAVLGSFAAAMAYRLARDLDWVRVRSACPDCGHRLPARALVPILSHLVQRGRCARCGAPIHWRYWVSEGLGAALAACAVAMTGPSGEALALMALATGGIVIATCDLEAGFIPDEVLVALAVIGLARAWARDMLPSALAAAILGFCLLWALRAGFRRWRGLDALGLGDVKLIGVAGLWLGLGGVSPFLVLAAGLGLILAAGLGRRSVPFGPALVIAWFAVVLIGPVPAV